MIATTTASAIRIVAQGPDLGRVPDVREQQHRRQRERAEHGPRPPAGVLGAGQHRDRAQQRHDDHTRAL
jgi:hypothetical protein